MSDQPLFSFYLDDAFVHLVYNNLTKYSIEKVDDHIKYFQIALSQQQ